MTEQFAEDAVYENGHERDIMSRLALGAVLGPILFNLAWVFLGVLQPTTRNMYGIMGGIAGAISNPISGLGVGPHAVLFNAVFITCGAITLVGILASLHEAPGPLATRLACAGLLSLSPIGLVMAGVWTIESSIPLHSLAAALAFVAPPFGFVMTGWLFRSLRRLRRFGNALLVAGPLTFLLLVIFALTFDQQRVADGQGFAGLTERILMLEIGVWYVALGWRRFRGEA